MHARVGMPIDSAEGPWGEVDDFVVDPTNWHLTHLVVQPHRHHERSHLVPVNVVQSDGERLTLRLTASEIEHTPKVAVTEFIKIEPPATYRNGWTTDSTIVNAWPYYPLATGGSLAGHRASGHSASGLRYASTKFEDIPAGEVEIRRSSNVLSSDERRVGTVDGFVFDDDGSITHLVLDHGHLWGRREVTIPIEHVLRANRERVRLDVTREQIGEFPAVKFHRHARVA